MGGPVVPAVSIIICTYNRCVDLAATLQSVAGVAVPVDLPTELLVVDNASTDETSRVVAECGVANMPVRYLYEARKGKAGGLNRAMVAALGSVFLFTDDDVRVPANWIDGMARPLAAGAADATIGAVRLAPHLERPRMTSQNRGWFAATDGFVSDAPEQIVGANMAIHRRALDRVPLFDVALGPGRLGFGEDSLFFERFLAAGLTAASALDVVVEHHFDAGRLTRASLVQAAWRFGRSTAYIAYCFGGKRSRRPYLSVWRAARRLLWWRATHRNSTALQEGLTPDEFDRVFTLGYSWQFAAIDIRGRRPLLDPVV